MDGKRFSLSPHTAQLRCLGGVLENLNGKTVTVCLIRVAEVTVL